jgi:hypothetical protein
LVALLLSSELIQFYWVLLNPTDWIESVAFLFVGATALQTNEVSFSNPAESNGLYGQ